MLLSKRLPGFSVLPQVPALSGLWKEAYIPKSANVLPNISQDVLGSAGAPAIDVVFVHGIRGGSFASWRSIRLPRHRAGDGPMSHRDCWPSAWLARDCPEARLLSLEYAAPASGWEVCLKPQLAMSPANC